MARTMGEGVLRLWKTMRDDEAVAAEGGRRDGGGMAAPAPSSSSSLSLFIFTLFNSCNCLPSVHGLKIHIHCQFASVFLFLSSKTLGTGFESYPRRVLNYFLSVFLTYRRLFKNELFILKKS
jgi:hypothetical protein